jgi:hypothetical protein
VRIGKITFWSVFGTANFVLVSLLEHTARADVSSWLFVGGGVTQVGKFSTTDSAREPTLRLATGMGTDPAQPFIVGGLIRLDTLFGRGSDLTAALRLADYGFVNGNWGIAVDVGGLARFWGPTDIYGGTATVIAGAPWGLELELGGLLGSHGTQGFSAILGIDLARLTVYRQSGRSWWKNTFPAVRPAESGPRE